MRKIFIIQHTESGAPGKILFLLEKLGMTFEILKLFETTEFKVPAQFDGVIILGGGMSVNDEDIYSWNKPECEFIRHLVKKEIPLIGICLGGQMIAKAHGAKIQNNHTPEFGWSEIRPTEFAQNDKFYKIQNMLPVYQWHYETFEIPKNAIRLSYSGACDNQAFKLGERCYGLQYHPETYFELIQDWVYKEDGVGEIDDLRAQGFTQFVQTGAMHVALAKKYDRDQNEHLLQLMKVFE